MSIHCGVAKKKNIRRARLSMAEIEEAVREHGISGIGEVNLAVLEADGNISVLSGNDTKCTVKKRKAPKVKRSVA